MNNRKARMITKISLPMAVVSSIGALSLSMPITADATTSPAITLSGASGLYYGYGAPVSVTVTGQDFNGSSVAYVFDAQGNSVAAASGFQSPDSTHLTFNLGGGLGSATGDTTYEVEVKTVESGNVVETTQEAQLVIHAVASINPPSVQAGYAASTGVTVTLTNTALDSTTTVQLLDGSGQPVSTAFTTTPTVTAQQVTASLNAGLAAGNYKFHIVDGTKVIDVPFSVAASTTTQLVINTTSLPSVTPSSSSYSAQLTANQSSGVTWSASNLPTWLSLNAQTGAITIKPSTTVPQSFQTMTLHVTATPTSGSPALKDVVLPLASTLSITTSSLSDATVGTYYSATLQANQSGVTWSVTGLPAGLTYSTSTGVISGTPTTATNATLQVTATTSSGGTATSTIPLIVQVSGSSNGGSGSNSGGSNGSGGNSGGGSNGGGSGTGSGGGTGSTGSGTGGDTGSGSGTGSGSTSFGTVLTTQTVDKTGSTITQYFSGSAVAVVVPAGAFEGSTQLTLSTTDTSTLSSVLPKGSSAVVALGVNFSGLAPMSPITVTIKNPAIPANAQIFKLTDNGSLIPVKATVIAGQATISFTSDPNFIVVKPISVTGSQRVIQFNGQSWIVPGIVKNGTTYMPAWYVMQALKGAGVTSTWDGQNWKLTTSGSADLTNVKSGYGNKHIWLNGTLVQSVDGMSAIDPSSHQPTMYMPVWYVMQALQRVGVQSAWDGSHWVLSK